MSGAIHLETCERLKDVPSALLTSSELFTVGNREYRPFVG
jgi:hypothetical protein